jgi:uncharacterized protein Veg
VELKHYVTKVAETFVLMFVVDLFHETISFQTNRFSHHEFSTYGWHGMASLTLSLSSCCYIFVFEKLSERKIVTSLLRYRGKAKKKMKKIKNHILAACGPNCRLRSDLQ